MGARRAFLVGRSLPPPVLYGLMIGLLVSAAPAYGQQVRITKLTNDNFGSIANLSVDATIRQNVCVFSSTATKGYNITATGSGTGGSFTLSAGSATLAYVAQWNSASGQTSGTALSPKVRLGGLRTTATIQTCGSGPTTTSSLIVILPTASLTSARAGNYSGTLTLLIAPE